MQEGKLSERALKRSVLRPLQQTVQKKHQNKAETSEYGADCAALVEEAGCVTLFSTVNTVPGFEHAPDKLIVAAANGLAAAGALLVGTEHGEALVSHLAAQGIFAAVIGRATSGKDRVIRNGEECRYLDRPKQDEWYRRLEYERANINVSGKEQ